MKVKIKRPDNFSNFSKSTTAKFAERVRAVVRDIKKGETMTYGQVAYKAGNPGAARAVGTIMANNFDKTVPCHRVIRADGKIGRYNRGGEKVKRALLRREGVVV